MGERNRLEGARYPSRVYRTPPGCNPSGTMSPLQGILCNCSLRILRSQSGTQLKERKTREQKKKKIHKKKGREETELRKEICTLAKAAGCKRKPSSTLFIAGFLFFLPKAKHWNTPLIPISLLLTVGPPPSPPPNDIFTVSGRDWLAPCGAKAASHGRCCSLPGYWAE